MDIKQLENLSALRIIIGYLGEKAQFAWWQSSFFSSASGAFLSPIFPRTQFLAQCVGVTRAAALMHDQRIGVGSVYHLFRLPEDIEQGIHRMMHDPSLYENVLTHVSNQKEALDYLRVQSAILLKPGVGPTRLGSIHDLRQADSWRMAAAHYLAAFEQGSQVYPYFADLS
jgi:hypothetical protein